MYPLTYIIKDNTSNFGQTEVTSIVLYDNALTFETVARWGYIEPRDLQKYYYKGGGCVYRV